VLEVNGQAFVERVLGTHTFGHPHEQLVGASVLTLVPFDDRTTVLTTIQALLLAANSIHIAQSWSGTAGARGAGAVPLTATLCHQVLLFASSGALAVQSVLSTVENDVPGKAPCTVQLRLCPLPPATQHKPTAPTAQLAAPASQLAATSQRSLPAPFPHRHAPAPFSQPVALSPMQTSPFLPPPPQPHQVNPTQQTSLPAQPPPQQAPISLPQKSPHVPSHPHVPQDRSPISVFSSLRGLIGSAGTAQLLAQVQAPVQQSSYQASPTQMWAGAARHV